MNKIIFLSAQPDVPYFHWQAEVFIHNAMKNGINPNWIEMVFAYDNQPSKEGYYLASKYPFVRFFFYKKNQIENYGYIPILRPDVLSQHFFAYPELEQEVIFYHDSDIIFRELPNFDSLRNDDNWYLSDTISYIGSKYIKSKGEDLFQMMCGIAGIKPEIVEENEENSGGAQYLLKDIDGVFWIEVKDMSLALFKFMSDAEALERQLLSPEQLSEYNPIQKWCADMWAVLWTGLRRGKKIRISKELDFSWGSSRGQAEWNKCKIMHNAGVTDNDEGRLFYKGEFIDKDPWNEDFSKIDSNTNSYNYVQAILYAKEMRKKY